MMTMTTSSRRDYVVIVQYVSRKAEAVIDVVVYVIHDTIVGLRRDVDIDVILRLRRDVDDDVIVCVRRDVDDDIIVVHRKRHLSTSSSTYTTSLWVCIVTPNTTS
jgi:hypothetical protein